MKKQMSPSVIDLPADAGDPALTLLNIAKCSILAVILGIRLQCVCYIMLHNDYASQARPVMVSCTYQMPLVAVCSAER